MFRIQFHRHMCSSPREASTIHDFKPSGEPLKGNSEKYVDIAAAFETKHTTNYGIEIMDLVLPLRIMFLYPQVDTNPPHPVPK